MWVIDGKVLFSSGLVIISINHEPVLKGEMEFWTGDGVLSGTYKEMPVSAKCKYYPQLFRTSYQECAVLINDELAAVVRVEQPGG